MRRTEQASADVRRNGRRTGGHRQDPGGSGVRDSGASEAFAGGLCRGAEADAWLSPPIRPPCWTFLSPSDGQDDCPENPRADRGRPERRAQPRLPLGREPRRPGGAISTTRCRALAASRRGITPPCPMRRCPLAQEAAAHARCGRGTGAGVRDPDGMSGGEMPVARRGAGVDLEQALDHPCRAHESRSRAPGAAHAEVDRDPPCRACAACGRAGVPVSKDQCAAKRRCVRPPYGAHESHGGDDSWVPLGVKDWCGEATSFPRELAEAALAHTVGDATERPTGAAMRSSELNVLMEAWERHCAGRAREILARLRLVG